MGTVSGGLLFRVQRSSIASLGQWRLNPPSQFQESVLVDISAEGDLASFTQLSGGRVLYSQSRDLGVKPRQGRNLVRNVCSTCAPIQLSHDEHTNRRGLHCM